VRSADGVFAACSGRVFAVASPMDTTEEFSTSGCVFAFSGGTSTIAGTTSGSPGGTTAGSWAGTTSGAEPGGAGLAGALATGARAAAGPSVGPAGRVARGAGPTKRAPRALAVRRGCATGTTTSDRAAGGRTCVRVTVGGAERVADGVAARVAAAELTAWFARIAPPPPTATTAAVTVAAVPMAAGASAHTRSVLAARASMAASGSIGNAPRSRDPASW
jgi:hypothetical protein